MKTTALVLILFLTGFELWAQNAPVRQTPSRRQFPVSIATNSPAAQPAVPVLPAAAPALPAANAAPAAPGLPATAAGLPADPANPAAAAPAEEMIPAGNINFQGVDVAQGLEG